MEPKAFDDTDIMFFGAHKGLPMRKVPASYLLWLWDASDELREMAENPVQHFKHAGNPFKNNKVKLAMYIKDVYDALIKDCPDYLPIHPYQRSR